VKKQLVFLAILGFSLFFSNLAYSVTVGNPSFPSVIEEGCVIPDTDWSNLQGGFYVDFLIQKKLQAPSVRKAFLSGVSEIGCLIWSIRDRFNLQIALGSGQFHFRYDASPEIISGEMRGGLIWSSDAKLILFQTKDTMLALSGSVGGWDWMDGFSNQNGEFVTSKTSSLLRYWQVALAFTQQISIFFPYLGIAWNRTRLEMNKTPLSSVSMHAWHDLGPFGGCSLSSGDRFLMNMEWRGWFEDGLSFSFQLRF
jgi:hypothetical protein